MTPAPRGRWRRLREPAALRALAALPCLLLVALLLRLGMAPLRDSAGDWIDQGSAAVLEYQRARELFAATEVRLLQLDAGALRSQARVLTESLLAAPDVVEVVSASQLQPDWQDLPDHVLPYGCDSAGRCQHMDDLRWAEARALHGPLSERLQLLDREHHSARLLVLGRSALDAASEHVAEPTPRTLRRSRPSPVSLESLEHAWLTRALPWLLLLASCLVAGLRRSWRLALPAIAVALLASLASRAVLSPLGWPASIAEPAAEVACFALVLAAALHVLSRERTETWWSGAENPWRMDCVGAGESARALFALALASASLTLVPIKGLQAFAAQCSAGLLIGAALASTLLPACAALLPRQSLPMAVEVKSVRTQHLGHAALASMAVLCSIALPLWLTALVTAEHLSQALVSQALAEPRERTNPRLPYADVPCARLEALLTTPTSQLDAPGLARLERAAQQLANRLPLIGVIEPSLLLREAAFQAQRASLLPGPWLAEPEAGVAGRLLQQYVADQGRTTRMTLLLQPPPGIAALDFARRLPIEWIAWRLAADLPDAQITLTGPQRLLAAAAFDPLRLSSFLVLAVALALAFPALARRR